MQASLRAALASLAGIEVVGSAGDGLPTLNLVRERQPDLLVVDCNLLEDDDNWPEELTRHEPLWFTRAHDRSTALKLLSIQCDQAIAQLICQSNINRVTASDPMIGGNGSSSLRHRQCDWSQFDQS
jgi:DNA-binding NarL/FixJ family response regulator